MSSRRERGDEEGDAAAAAAGVPHEKDYEGGSSPLPAGGPHKKGRKDAASPLLLYVSGAQSGVGKSTLCLGVLRGLIDAGVAADRLAYIKPCTQCEDVQMISKFCEREGVAHRGIGPVRFYQGFTAAVISGEDAERPEERRARVVEAVREIGRGKEVVLVDGVGYPGVGSTAGVSNAEVAAALGAPVLVVGRPGVGNAIDSFSMIRVYFEAMGVRVLGAVFGNVPAKASYHTPESCHAATTAYFARILAGSCAHYGTVPRLEARWRRKLEESEATGGVACVLRETKAGLACTDEEHAEACALAAHVAQHVDVPRLLRDLRAL